MTDFDVLMQMGFSRENIKYALSATQGHSMDEAIDLLLDHKLDVEFSGDAEKKGDRPANSTEVFHAKVSLQNAPSSDTGAKRTKRYTKTRSKRKLKHSNSYSILGSYNSKLPTIQEEEGTEQHFSTTEVYQMPTNSKGTSTQTPAPSSKGHKTIRKCSDCGKSCSRKIQSEYHTFRTGHEHFIEVPKPRKQRTHKQKALVKEATRAAEELSHEILVTSEYLKSLESSTEPESPEPEAAAPTEVPNKQNSYTFTRIQLRLLDGQTMNATFLSTDPLGSLREFVDKHTSTKHDYDLITAFPRRTFTAEDYSKTFLELGLIPTIVIIMTKKH